MIEQRYLTVAQAAEQLQTSPEMVRRMLREGRLRGKRLGGKRMGWRVAQTEVERLLQPDERSRPGPRPQRDISLAVARALAEAEKYRANGNEAETRRWEQIAAGIATSTEA